MKSFAIILSRSGRRKREEREIVRANLTMYNVSIFRNVTMNPPVQQMYDNKNALRKKINSLSKSNK
jgi:hypothetical protein